ncbi:pre-RNA processing PIH1/Nop17-domain-containing protein [Jimgerdemannia flammicorona]|uniref:Pre-RNA processing PIH1/Nop17-domain-containing protein n=1 Tax=Jimgerdemannia flammicorona TaxID=994334 RepID=A0A433QKJ9_9FUNG|nr:pre-RNA processing PIH1/Nop17-domain-containing protein [Jimgerdemannia flammicorona]
MSTSFLDIGPNDASHNPFLLSELTNEDVSVPSTSFDSDDALVEHFSQEFAKNPEALQQLAAHLVQPIGSSDATTARTVEVHPTAGFVCKTATTTETKKHMQGTNVYINVCYAPEIPQPITTTEREIQRALNAEPGAVYQIPLSLGEMRGDANRAGKPNLVFDACIHTNPYVRAERDLDYRLYVLELAMELVEEKEGVTLSRGNYMLAEIFVSLESCLSAIPYHIAKNTFNFTFPEFKMPNIKSKGTIPKRVIRLPKPPLVSELAPSSTSAMLKIQPITTSTKAKSKTDTLSSDPQAATPKYEISRPNGDGLTISIHLSELVGPLSIRLVSDGRRRAAAAHLLRTWQIPSGCGATGGD